MGKVMKKKVVELLKTLAKTLVKIGVTAGVIYWIIQKFGFETIVETVKSADPIWLIFGTTLFVISIFLGAFQCRAHWLYAAAMLVGGAAVMRTIAFLLHDAPFATQFIVPEVVMTAMLVGAAMKIESDG